MQGIIIYQSTYGSTKQYAEWIHAETGFPMLDARTPNIPWEKVDVVVIGCPILANRPSLAGWIRGHWPQMEGKRVLLYTTSGADPKTTPVEAWIKGALPEEIRSKIAFFPLAGRFHFGELKAFHKAMLWMVGFLFGNKDVKHQIRHPVDGVAKENLRELLHEITPTAARGTASTDPA